MIACLSALDPFPQIGLFSTVPGRVHAAGAAEVGPSSAVSPHLFENVIPNGEFERDSDKDGIPDGWEPGETPSFVRLSETGCRVLGEGGAARKALWATGGRDGAGEWSVPLSGIEPETYYLLSFQVFRQEFHNGWYPEIELFGRRYLLNQHATFGRWQQFELLLKAPAGATNTWFRFMNAYPCTFWITAPSLRPFRLVWLEPAQKAGRVGLRWLEAPSRLVYELELFACGSSGHGARRVRFLNADSRVAAGKRSGGRQKSVTRFEIDERSGGIVNAIWLPFDEKGSVSARLVSYFQGEATAEIRLETEVKRRSVLERRPATALPEALEPARRLPEGFFPIGLYNVTPDEESMGRVQAAGFNTVHVLLPGGWRGPPEGLEWMAGLPLKVMLDWDRGFEKRTEGVPGMGGLEKNLLCWYIADEPELGGVPPLNLYLTRRRAAKRYPALLTAAAVLRGASLPYYQYCADLFLIDPYPVPNQPLSWLADALDAAAEIVGPERSLAVIQAFGGETYAAQGWDRFPTVEEMRALAFLAVVHGARGVFFYDYPSAASRHEYWKTLCRVVADVGRLADWLTVPGSQEGVTQWVCSPMGWRRAVKGAGAHVALKRKADGSWLLILVNPEQRPFRVRVGGLPGQDAVLMAMLEHGPAVLKRGNLDDDLNGFEVKAYEYAPPTTLPMRPTTPSPSE